MDQQRKGRTSRVLGRARYSRATLVEQAFDKLQVPFAYEEKGCCDGNNKLLNGTRSLHVSLAVVRLTLGLQGLW